MTIYVNRAKILLYATYEVIKSYSDIAKGVFIMNERKFYVLMREVCAEMNIKIEELSYGWILQLSKDDKVRHITGTRFDLNSEATGNIACDKYATYEVLNSQNIPIIKHVMVFNPMNRAFLIEDDGIWSIVVSEFLKYGCLVVKPNYGCEGQGVFLCHTLKEIEFAIHELFKTQSSVSICPYYDIRTEYRTFYLDGKVYLIYGKTIPFVIGDGVSSIGKLVEKLNLPNKSVVQENLEKLDLNYVPGNGEKINISWKHNLSGGAKPEILLKGELYDRIEQLAIKAGKAMNIKFATIDIIETTDNNLYVLEINSGIGATIFSESVEDGDAIIKEIYKHAIQKMFQ